VGVGAQASTVDVSPLVAVTLANWGSITRPPRSRGWWSREALAAPRRAPEEAKADAVLPEHIWEQVLAAGDAGGVGGLERAVGLPAVLAVIRLISHAVALVPLHVVNDDQLRARAYDTWQWRLLKRPGAPPVTAFGFKADVAANFAGRGNAYVRKLKPTRVSPDRPRVIELMSLNAGKVKPERSKTTGAVVFKDGTADGKPGHARHGRDHPDPQPQPQRRARGALADHRGADARVRGPQARRVRRAPPRERDLPRHRPEVPRGIDEETGKRWIKSVEAQHKGSARRARSSASAAAPSSCRSRSRSRTRSSLRRPG
jgi:hypothetical protein